MSRDPLTDPQAGDVLEDPAGRKVQVDAVRDGWIYYWAAGTSEIGPGTLRRKPLHTLPDCHGWVESCAASGMRVVP